MIAFPKTALALAALSFSSLAAAQVTFFEQENFAGRNFTTKARVANLARFGFNDRASSVEVANSRWEVCEDARFRGPCVVLRPGTYPSLASMGLNNSVTSVRPVGARENVQDSRYAPAPAPAKVTFYSDPGLRGQAFTSTYAVTNFRQVGYNDRASSAEVAGSRWEACEDAQYGGRCVVLRPGRYGSLNAMGLNNQVTSVRPLRWSEEVANNRYAPMPGAGLSAEERQERQERRDFRRRNNERTYQANVTSVRAVVGTPEQRCWVEREQVQSQSGINVPGTIVGAVIGGILGHQVGSGTTQDVARIGGMAAGGYVGNKIGQSQSQPAMQDVQKCASVPSQTPTYWDVTYNFRGQEHRVQMTTQPGATVTVNEQGEPRT